MKIICCPGCGSNFTTWTAATKTTNKQPLILSCGHTFCELCIAQKTKTISTAASRQAQITCPTCKHVTLLENGAKDLPVNVYLSAYIEMNQRGRLMEHLGLNLAHLVPAGNSNRSQRASVPEVETTEGGKCKMCVMKKATCKCVDCDSVLCASCFEKVHSLSVAIKHHVPVPLSSVCQFVTAGGGDAEAKCAEHNRILEYFCEDDSLSICSRCYIVGSHQNHSITSIEDKNKLVLEEINGELPTARLVLQHLNRIDKKIVSIQPSLKTETKSLIETVSSSFLKLHSLIQAREMEIVKMINSAYKDQIISIDKQRDMMEKTRHELEDAIKKSNILFENSATFLDGHALLEILRKARSIPCIVEKREVMKEAQLTWHETNQDNLTAIISAYGRISGTPRMPIQFTTIEESPERLEEEDKLSVNSLGSEASIQSVGGTASVPGCASSVDTGEDVVVEETDVEPNVPRNSRHVPRETVSLPVIKGPAQKVTVTHIRSPNEFCVQLASSKRQLEYLSHSVNAWCRKSNSAKHVPLVVEKDMLLLARYTADKQWYRARVLGIENTGDRKDNSNKVHVKYIDFGNDELLPMKELRSMQARFMRFPVFAILCSLFDIAPFEEDKPWSVEAVQEFHKMTQNQMLMMTAIGMQGAVYEVDLICTPMADALDDNYVSIRDILIFLGLARFRTFSDASTTSSAPPSYPKVDFIQPTSVKNGTTLSVIVSHITSPWDVHVVCLGEEYEYYLSMHEEMQQMYNKDICNIYTLFYPRMDMVCAAQGSDGEWHRAKILSIPLHKEVSVKFVDLGSTETVRYDHLKKLHSSFIRLPVQAIPCQLMDVCPVDGPAGQWSDEAKLWCHNNLTGVVGQARFIRSGQAVHIVLWLECSTGLPCTKSVNFTLVDRGFAQSTGPSSLDTVEGINSCGTVFKNDNDYKKMHPKEPAAVSPLPQSLSRTTVSTNSSRGAMSDTSSSHAALKKTPMSPATGQKIEHKKKSSRGIQAKNKQSAGEAKTQQKVHSAPNVDVSLSSQKLETSYIEVFISNYISPSEFYVQVTETQNDLLQLMKDMQDVFNTSSAAPSQEWSANDYCAARFAPDDLWYRAYIVSQVSEDEFEVEYVDFGNVDVVKRSDLQPLLPEFGRRMPCAAARCHLANLLPAGSMDVNKWSQTAVEFMASLLKDRKLYIKQEGDPTDMGLPVDLIMEEEIPETAFEPKSHKYHSMRKAIIKNGLAMPAKKQSEPDPSTPDSPGSIPFQRFIFMRENEPEDLNQDRLEHRDVDQNALPNKTTNNSQVTKGAAEKEHEIIDTVSDSLESDQDDIFSLPPYPLPQLKVQMAVVPTYVDVDGIIYVQPYAWEGSCAHMSTELQRIYGQASPVGSTDWKVGLMCVALFPEDGFWYRAQILEMKDDQFKVCYADFGNTAWVGPNQLRRMLPIFAKEHPFAYRCVLYDLVPVSPSDSWPAEVLDYIQKLIVNHKCVLVVVEADDRSPLKVQLFRDDVNLCEDLISKNMAVSPLTLKRFSEQSTLIGDVLSRQNPYHQLDVGEVGDTFRALMIHIELPNVVYLQRNLEIEPEDSDFVKASEVAEINNTISEFVDMAEKLKSCRSMPMSHLPDVGMMCAAYFSTDNQLYRALCVQCFPETSSCLVVYVDYGTSEIVPRSSLRLLPSEFWSIPAQAVRCHISCPLPCESGRQLKHYTFVGIVSSLARRELMARIVSKSPLTVELLVEEAGKWQVPYKHLFEEPRMVRPSVGNPLVKTQTDDVTLLKVNNEQNRCENSNDDSADHNLKSLGEKLVGSANREAEDSGSLAMRGSQVLSSLPLSSASEKYNESSVLEAGNSSEDDDDDDDDIDWVAVAAKLVEQKVDGK